MKTSHILPGLLALSTALSAAPAALAAPDTIGARITHPGESAYSEQVTINVNKSMVVAVAFWRA